MNVPKNLFSAPSSITRKERSSYERWLKDDLGQLINAVEKISELQRHSLRSRWLDQVLWMEKKASQCQRWYYTLRLIAIVGALIVPAIVGLNVDKPQLSGYIAYTTFGLSLLVAISIAIEEFFRFGERWRHYRSTAERLKIEGWQFFQLAGPYQDFKDHALAYPSFATRTETIQQQEVDVFITEIAKEKKKEQGENAQNAIK